MPGPQNFNIKPKIEPGITIKQEPMASSSKAFKDLKGPLEALRLGSSRLPSFRGPRDLTLSGTSTLQLQPRPKKTFLPNIPVRREKGERAVESRSEKSIKRSPNKFKNERDRGRGRGRGREREMIQTKGTLFGEGIAASAFIKRSMDHGGYEGGRGGSKIGEMQKPVLNMDAVYKIDSDMEEKRLKEILRDDFIDDPDDIDAIVDQPVQLPLIAKELRKTKVSKSEGENSNLDTISSSTHASLDGMDMNMRARVKLEPGLEVESHENSSSETIQPETSLKKAYNFPKESVAFSLLTSREDELIEIQLPTCLPSLPPEPSLDERQSTGSDFTNSSARPTQNAVHTRGAPSNPRSTVDSLPEGLIGNMRMYESGRVELCVGDHVFNIEKGVPAGFLQDCVKIDADAERRTGTMTVLGHVKDRFVVLPNFDLLVKNAKRS